MLSLPFQLLAWVYSEIAYVQDDSNQLFCLTYVAATIYNVIDCQLGAVSTIFAFKRARK